jgi:SAM-dependent methyltransferase/SOS-response transcriptional repressor LexA
MDRQTIEFYGANSADTARRYAEAKSGVARLFPVAFPPGARVLDVGCGSGRDLNALIDAGYAAEGIDAAEEMIREAARHFPRCQGRMAVDSLPQLNTVEDSSLEGVLCSAVLMHVPEESLFDTVFNIRRILKKGGHLVISTPLTGPVVDASTHRDEHGRLFNGITPENFQFLFEKIGFRQVNRWETEDSLDRADRRWCTQLFVLESQGSRSLDKIEGILNRDKKDATYKPALFRALAELATTSYHSAIWLPGGKVCLPLKLIADKWLEYYWPLMESEIFIPQKRGEERGCQKPVKFRAQMEELVAAYRPMGGLTGFTAAYRSNALPEGAAALLRKLKSTLRATIREGPLYYSGGGGSHTFEYDHSSRSIVMDADLWRELSMMGNWIADATILRWAELTAEISRQNLKPSQVIDQLLRTSIPEREVSAARSLYEGLAEKVCVWTDETLGSKFEVDHAIPFVLWKNNDLWNLLPALPTINNHKRDRLPTHDLLQHRKDCMVHYWTLMRENNPIRFDFEASKLAGVVLAAGHNWENRLFGTVAEAVEVTAIQRGVERWQPANAAWAPAAVSFALATPDSGESPQEAQLFGAELILLDPPLTDRFVTCIPFYDVAAAAGTFGPDQPAVDLADHHSWIRVSNLRPTQELFAIRVVGHSMEPRIPDRAYCVFRGGSALAGSRHGRIVLVALRDSVDPETGGRLTVKRYSSEKVYDEDGVFAHTQIVLKPLNPDFEPVTLRESDEPALRVIGEFVQVLGAGT